MAIVSLADLRDMDLADAAGNRLGAVKDILIDLPSGRVRYAVVAPAGGGPIGSIGAAFGLDERLVPIPFALLRVQNGQLLLGRDPASLAGAPAYGRHRPPSFDDAYEGEVADYWGVAAGASSDGRDVTAGDLARGAAPTVPASADLGTLARTLARGQSDAAQVVDAQGRVVGVVTLRDVGLALARAQGEGAAPVAAGPPRQTAPQAGAWSVVDASPVEQADTQAPGGLPPVPGTSGAGAETPNAAPSPSVGAAEAAPRDAGAQPAGSSAAGSSTGAQPSNMYAGMGGPQDQPPSVTAPWPGLAAPSFGADTGQTGVQAPSSSSAAPAGAETPAEMTSRCPTCGAVNRAGALFCAKCGTRLR